MKRWSFFGLFLVIAFLLYSCSDGNDSDSQGTGGSENGSIAQKTLIVYMMAENSLSGPVRDYAQFDIDELLEAAKSVPSDCRLFAYVDDELFPRMYQFYSTRSGGKCEIIKEYENDVCSSSVEELSSVLSYILDEYPTKELDIVLWSHGNGWLRGKDYDVQNRSIGLDNGKNDFSDAETNTIEIEDLATVLGNLPVRVERLMFDACFMQCVEVAYALRNAVNWIIASPAEIPGFGAPYADIAIAMLNSQEPEPVIDVYIDSYKFDYSGAVLSAVRTSEMQRLAEVTSVCVRKCYNVSVKRDMGDVFSYLPGGELNPLLPSFYDMNAVMLHAVDLELLSEIEYREWKNVLDGTIVYSASSPFWYSMYRGGRLEYDNITGCGMSMYVPMSMGWSSPLNDAFSTTEWYDAAGWKSAGW